MKKLNTVTCSFTMDRETYNAYKSIITDHGESVKGNKVRNMLNVIKYQTSNVENIQAIEEVEELYRPIHLRKNGLNQFNNKINFFVLKL